MTERGERPTQMVVETLISDAKWKLKEEKRATAEQAQRAKRSLRSSKSYRDRRAAEIEAGRLEAEKRAAEQRAAAQQAVDLIRMTLPPPDLLKLISLAERAGSWRFADALRRLGTEIGSDE
jgi:regulator of protease activity HflC (stomatin/prohibitin superfamily)